MAQIEKLQRDLEKTKHRIAVLQERQRTLTAQLEEAENLEIVQAVRAVKMKPGELSAFLKAYAAGRIMPPREDDADEED